MENISQKLFELNSTAKPQRLDGILRYVFDNTDPASVPTYFNLCFTRGNNICNISEDWRCTV
ncbi:hypothetical protein E2C01_011044 [Portunus trituberculatus]|uniref:Uncharacterized protein n=1 Tax=Portunus trituberculatus TaxID=210409 RepID=A0A5B7D9Z4_PORTR|nr:hypothetical protein [Portunus trituberculatus]